MKILMICHFVPYPPNGGSLQRTFNIFREIAKENTVHLLALNQKALLPDKESIENGVKALSSYCDVVKVFEIPSDASKFRTNILLLCNMFSKFPYSVWKFKSSQLRRELIEQFESNDFDLVYYDTIDMAQYSDLSPNKIKIMNHHNMESALLIRRGASEKNPLFKIYILLQGLKLKRYERLQMSKFNINFVVSDTDGDNLKKLAPSARFETIPNGSDIEFFTPGPEIDSHEIVFAGGMNWYPNRDAMLFFCNEVFPLIKEAVPDAVMNIIGQDPPDQIKKVALNDKSIKVHGFVKDVRGYIARSAVYVCPIRVGGGTRLKILDAFASGKALVSTSIGCEGIEVTPGENILIANSPAGFAENVITLLNNKELRGKLEINARKLVVDKYSWGIIGKKVRRILSEATK